MRVLLCLAALTASSCIRDAYAGDFLESCSVLGGDAGNVIRVGPNVIQANSQFMVTANYQVNYRVCKPLLPDGGGICTATSTDAPIAASSQVDLCMPSGYAYASFYKLYDGGNPTVCAYLVSPPTVCQIR
jgi:hypothetical protein